MKRGCACTTPRHFSEARLPRCAKKISDSPVCGAQPRTGWRKGLATPARPIFLFVLERPAGSRCVLWPRILLCRVCTCARSRGGGKPWPTRQMPGPAPIRGPERAQTRTRWVQAQARARRRTRTQKCKQSPSPDRKRGPNPDRRRGPSPSPDWRRGRARTGDGGRARTGNGGWVRARTGDGGRKRTCRRAPAHGLGADPG